MRRIGFIGDIHGCIDELRELHRLLVLEGVDEVWCTGDYVDRGPDSEAVIQYCIEHNIRGVCGNHDSVIRELNAFWVSGGKTKFPTRSEDKQRTLSQLSPSSIKYLEQLPWLAVFDDLNTVLVHGGLFPHIPLYEQLKHGHMLCRLQLIRRWDYQETRWFNIDRKGRTEEQNRQERFHRWYHLYDGPQNIVFGHSVFPEPLVYQNENCGTCYGIDQGGVFGGSLTGLILPDVKFISVPCIDTYNNSKDLTANAD